jgi:hypothetical protein
LGVTISERRLSLGGVETAIRCADAALLDALCRPYAAWSSTHSTQELTVDYTVDPAADPAPYRMRREQLIPSIDRGVAAFRGPAERGAIDVALRLALCVMVPRLGGLIVHAACAVDPEGALLFTGPSGAGKSTLYRLLAGSGAYPQLFAD